jgi:hypothetical protein
MKNITFLLLITLISCSKPNYTPQSLIEWQLITGYVNPQIDSVHLYALQTSEGYWLPDSIGTTWSMPGPSDFQFAYSWESLQFAVRSPYPFHHEDFSLWDSYNQCLPSGGLLDLQIHPEHNYYQIHAQLDTAFVQCLQSTDSLTHFRFGIFQ